MVRGLNFCACAARKFITTVLPEPDGPMTEKLPRSPWWKLKKNGVELVVSQQRDRIAPVIALGLAQREAVQAAEAGHVGGGDHRAAHEVLLVAGELAPEGRLEIGVLAHGDRAGIGQRGGAGGGGIVEPVEVAFAHQHGQVMVAEGDRAGAELVARGHHLGALGTALPRRPIAGGGAARSIRLARGLAFVRGEAFGHDHLARQAQQRIEQARAGRVGIVLEAQDGGEIGAAASRAVPSRRARSWRGDRAASGRYRSRRSGRRTGRISPL